MPPEILTEFRCMCCKSQDISSGIMELGKIRCEFGSRIAPTLICNWENYQLMDRFRPKRNPNNLNHTFQPLNLDF